MTQEADKALDPHEAEALRLAALSRSERAPAIAVALREVAEEARREGVRAAANFIGTFDQRINHDWHIEDVVLCKFNLLPKHKMRQKDHRGRKG